MKKLLLTALVLTALYGCKDKGATTENTSAATESQLYHNGDILTMVSDTEEYAEALVVQDGKIVFVGNKAEAEAQFGKAEKIDLHGKSLLPGFIDPHSHFGMVSNSMGQVDLNPPPVGNVSDIPHLLQTLKEYKENNKIAEGEWIFGWGYDDGQLTEKRHPTKEEIDQVLPNNPVYLIHTSGHMGVANSPALIKMQITAQSADPEGGYIGRMKNSKEPNGLVQETAIYPFMGFMLQLLSEKQGEFFDQTQDYYIQNGITTAQDGMTDRNALAFFQQQADEGKLKIDLIALPGFSELDQNLADENLKWKTYQNGFKSQGTKIIADGSPQGKTAFFTKPFLTEVPGCESDCRGLPSLSQEELNSIFQKAYASNNQLFIHCNGDASIDMVIHAHEFACKELDQPLDKDRRTILIHSQFVRPDQLETYRKYKMEPSFFTNHAYFWGDEHVRNLGKERADFLSPMVSAIKLGLKPTNHSDATVTPVDPLFTVWSAVNRISRSGAVIGETERATPYQALQAITKNAAFEFFEEDTKGTLEVGKWVDLVILDKNPLKVGPDAIKDIQVVETVKKGKTIYRK